MLQAAFLDCQFLDLCPFSDDGFVASEVDVGGCHVVQALVVSFVIVVINEGPDLAFKIAGQIVVFQQNPVLHGLMPALDLALGLWVERRSTNVIHLVIFQPFGQIARDVTRPVVAQQAWHVPNDGMIAPGRRQGQLNRRRHVLGPHVGAKFPANDVAAVIIQASRGLQANHCQLIDRAEIKPAPADDLEVGEVGLPHLVNGGGFVRELVHCPAMHVYMHERGRL
jgi:hypothetical protein